jgi:hypothetical protein
MPADSPYVLADNGVTLQAKKIDHWGALTLYEKNGPWKLLDAEQQVYEDGWMPEWSSYTYFKPGQKGTLEVTLSRTAFNGPGKGGNAKVAVSTVKIDPAEGGPAQGRIYAVKRKVVPNGGQVTLRFPVTTPVRAEVNIPNTFRASTSDPRQLGALVGFRFVPAKG